MSTPTNTDVRADTNAMPQLGSSLDIAHATALREELLSHVAMRSLQLDLSHITRCDLAGLQLLLAARASAAANEVPFQLDNPSPAVLFACATFGIDLATPSQQS